MTRRPASDFPPLSRRTFAIALGSLLAFPLAMTLVFRAVPTPSVDAPGAPSSGDGEPPVGAANTDTRSLPEPTLTSSVTEIDFGTVALGERATRRLVLTNNALDETTITLSSTWLSEPDALEFASDFDGPLVVPAGDSVAIELTFSPGEAGHRVGALYVSHDGASALDIFTLSGNGALPAGERAALRLRAKPAAGDAPRFGKSALGNLDAVKPTSLQFGPDGRLYVADMLGLIKVYDVERERDNDYRVTAVETIEEIQGIPNHDDDGRPNPKVGKRLVTGLLVTGTASAPVIYVNSSDPRIGGGPSHTETGLDTNSGVLSRLVRDPSGDGWTKLDLVRGLSRSEENHHPNGLALDESTNRLYLSAGGNTNMGAPSNNFAGLPEYALSAAILEVDLGRIGESTYDLPTLDDETRAGARDANDPFGGNDGRNQAKLVPGGPVQVYAPGFRNAYDLVLTEAGRMYTIDNGPNGNWGGMPHGAGASGVCTNARSEPGRTHRDSLHHVSERGYYGGHPNPTRANLDNTFNAGRPQSAVDVANPIECEYRPSGGERALGIFPVSVNGLTEYRASNFGGAMRGDLLAAGWDDVIHRLVIAGDGDALVERSALFSNAANLPLDVTAQADHERFPGTVWVADFTGKRIVVFEPIDYGGGSGGGLCGDPDGGTGPDADDDGDGFSNADEAVNGTDPCSAADVPADLDDDGVSDRVDDDDDGDGVPDARDAFALDPENGRGTSIPLSYDWENDSAPAGFLFDLGFSGLMGDGKGDYLDRFDLARLTTGGAAGVLTVDDIPPGDAIGARNDQDYAFQFGIDVTPATPAFTVRTRLLAPFAGAELGGYLSAGLFIGTGDQDNYIKLVANAIGASGSVELAAERESLFARVAMDAADVLGSDRVDLFLTVDPAAGTVTAFHRSEVDGTLGPIVRVGAATPLPRAWLEGDGGLAVGIIATSLGGKPFGATWDFVDVVDGVVVVEEGGGGIGDTGGGASSDKGVHVARGDTVAIEAERFVMRVDASDHRWVAGARPGAGGGASMVTTPDGGALARGTNGAPRLSYAVDFPSAGTWTVWVRGWGDANANGEGRSDSVHVGLDGTLSTAAAVQGFPAGGWAWSTDRRGGAVATLTVPSAGRHSVDLWMREDGLEVDRLVLTRAVGYVPAGQGPISTHQGSGTDGGADGGAGAGSNGADGTADGQDSGSGDGSEPGPDGTGGGTGGTAGGDPDEGMGGDGAGTGGSANGPIALEAERFDARADVSGHRWAAGSGAGASGGASMLATPDGGTLSRGANGSPRLSYSVDFPSAGTWTVWLRGAGDTNANGEGKRDSVHVGLDGAAKVVVQDFPAGGWSWSNARRGGGTATLAVPSAGRHTVDVWMREDGFALDRLVLSADAGYVPSGTGPAASSSDGGGDDGTTGGGSPGGGTSGSANGEDGDATAGDSDGGDSGDDDGGVEEGGEGAHDEAIALEAERFDARADVSGHRWAAGSGAGASGGASMLATPDGGTLSRGANGSPRLSYSVDFPSAGTWTVWLRGAGDTNANGEGKRDSVHVGLDGAAKVVVQDFPAGGWSWSNARRGGGTATLAVPSAGRHTVDVWMREDGFALDRLVLSADAGYVPSGGEPAASSGDGQGGGTSGDPGSGSGDGSASGTGGEGNASMPRADASTPWTRRTSANGSAAVARHEAGAVELDGRIYLVGGRGSRATSIFDPATNRWTRGAKPPFEMHHFQPLAHDGRLWVVGAMTCCYPREDNVAHVWTYTPSTDRWEKGVAIPENRRRGGAGAFVRDGKIYLVGGNTRGHDGGAVGWFDELDPATGRWRTLPSAPTARDHVQVAAVGDRLVVAGGRRSSQPRVFADTVARVDVYDFRSGRWSRGRDLPTQRAGAMTVATGGEVVVIGGESAASADAHDTVEAFDVAADRWRRLRPLNTGRHGGGAAVLGDGIHVVAGNTRRGGGAETSSHERLALPDR